MQIYTQLMNLVYFLNLRQISNLNLHQKNINIMNFYTYISYVLVIEIIWILGFDSL